ncbi:NADPH-dependent F420 reductase [Niabella beijingensis]|uniref:NADPH-dependent F420 reductase n=1 Tax=Niabella beijingensis TaxID=2872700 RepID=UPI001CBCF668|nr:NAD(P)-binding domain-containing protein [Niabella beijingensis]MBZ4189335.1 NAD(P)-binding domain-containing protein [Niabella beijingensis]
MTTISKVAIIGLGNIGQVVAANLAKSNRSFIAADRNIAKAKELSAQWGVSARPEEIPAAVKEADIVALSIPFGSIAGFIKQYAGDLEDKIIVDLSNPIAPDENGGFKKIIAQNESAGKINAASLPRNAKLAKALGTLGAASLANTAFQSPERSVLFYATDDSSIDGLVEQLILDTGFDPVRVGGLDQSMRIEVFGDLHEFGALGKTVTASEAKSVL